MNFCSKFILSTRLPELFVEAVVCIGDLSCDMHLGIRTLFVNVCRVCVCVCACRVSQKYIVCVCVCVSIFPSQQDTVFRHSATTACNSNKDTMIVCYSAICLAGKYKIFNSSKHNPIATN